MKIVLRADVDQVGKKGDIVDVADGFGRNYLLPKGLAFPASTGVEAQAAKMRASRDLRVAAIAADFAERLKGTRWSRDGSWSDLVAEVRHLRRELPRDPTVTELARLIERAAGLAGEEPDRRDRRRDDEF